MATTTKAAVAAKPFVASSFIHEEPFFDQTLPLTTVSQFIGPISVVPYGFLRRIWVQVEASGGTKGTAVVNAALPAAQAAVFVLQNVDFHDVNGASIIQNLNGFDLYLANRYGNYNQGTDLPDAYPIWDATATGGLAGATCNFKFGMYIPIEVANNGLCALANQDAAAKYQLSFTLAPIATLYSTAPTTAPNVRIRCYADCWAQPYATDIFGRPQTQLPPLLGATQFWTRYQKNVNSGLQTIDLERRGAYIRNLILYLQGGSAVNGIVPMDDADYPDPMTFLWDGQIVRVESAALRKATMVASFAQYGNAQPAGVFVYDNSGDTAYGDDNGALWYPTLTSTNMQFQGTFGTGSTPLTLNILTNDIAIPQASQ